MLVLTVLVTLMGSVMGPATATHGGGLDPIIPVHHQGEYFTFGVGDPVPVGTRWGVCTLDQAQSAVDAVILTLFIDGTEVNLSPTTNGPVPAPGDPPTPENDICVPPLNGEKGWTVRWTYEDVLSFDAPGTYEVTLVMAWDQAITDGMDPDGDGVPAVYGPGVQFEATLFIDVPGPGRETVNLVEPNGRWHMPRGDGTTHDFFYGNPGDVPLFGDWDGDGFDTPGMYRPTNGFAYLTNDLPADGGVGFGDPALTFFFGGPGDQVFVGDWDGDGIDTLGISRNGKMFLANTNATVFADMEFWFGNPTDIAFGGDPDGDGKDSVFLYRATSGFTYFTNSTPVGPNAVAPTHGTLFFGVPTDRFVIGDWNEDGTDTVGVFRPSDTTVYLRNDNTTGPAHVSYPFGQAPWLPVAGIWS